MSQSQSSSRSRSTSRSSVYGKPGSLNEHSTRPLSLQVQRGRSTRVESPGGDCNHGLAKDGKDLNSRHVSVPAPFPASAYPPIDPPPDYARAGLPVPPIAYVVMPQGEKKKSGLTRRLWDKFVVMTADPEFAALGSVPGQPTPDHILEQDEEKEAEEEKICEEGKRKKEELVRQSKVRRASAADAYRRQQREQEGQEQEQGQGRTRSQSLKNPPWQMRPPPSYNAVVPDRTHDSAQLPRFDSKRGYGRLSTQPSKYARQQVAEQQLREARRRSKPSEQLTPRRERQPQLQTPLRSRSGGEYDYEHELLAEYGLMRDVPSSTSSPS